MLTFEMVAKYSNGEEATLRARAKNPISALRRFVSMLMETVECFEPNITCDIYIDGVYYLKFQIVH